MSWLRSHPYSKNRVTKKAAPVSYIDIDDCTTKDLPRGESTKFTCHKTAIRYTIKSYKGDGVTEDILPTPRESILVGGANGGYYDIDAVHAADAAFTKRKHYYIYSKDGGYGKSTFMHNFCKVMNGVIVRDFKNMTGVSEKAQFLFVDEYGPSRRLDMDELKGLTYGTASGFTGNRKSYGASYTPRPDVQLIILSNKHLFDCMGTYDPKTKIRKVTRADADLLNQRFYIYRMDETKDSNEHTDALMHNLVCPFESTTGDSPNNLLAWCVAVYYVFKNDEGVSVKTCYRGKPSLQAAIAALEKCIPKQQTLAVLYGGSSVVKTRKAFKAAFGGSSAIPMDSADEAYGVVIESFLPAMSDSFDYIHCRNPRETSAGIVCNKNK